jgi:hypothetical protein
MGEYMGLSKVGYWLQIVGNLGILAGIMLVFIQIRQSNEITGAELFSQSLESTVARELALLGETPEFSMTRVLLEPGAATREDFFVADRVYMSILRQFSRAFILSEAGLYGTQESINAIGFININYSLFACPFGLAWLDERLATSPADSPFHQNLSLLRELAANRSASERFGDRIRRAEEIARQLDSLKNRGNE